MIRLVRFVFVAAFIFGTSLSLAQGPLVSTGNLTYRTDTGVEFGVPEGWVLDSSGSLPKVSFNNNAIVIEMVEPAVIGVTPEDTANAPLLSVLDYLLGLIGFEGERSAEATSEFTLLDGREIVAFDFTNSSNNVQTMLVMRFTNTFVGAMNIRSVAAFTSEERQIILAIANSFDQKPLDPAEAIAEAERQLTEGFSEPYAYDSGVSFRFPQEFVIDTSNGDPVQIGIANVILITMVDPTLVGLPAGEAMEEIIGFAVGTSDIDPASFEALDVGGREAVIASAPTGQFMQTMVLVRFNDGTVGIMDILSVSDLTDEQLLQVRGIAASFNSAEGSVALSRNDLQAAEQAFKDAMAAREAGEIETALAKFGEAIGFNPGMPLAYYWRGITLRSTGDLEGSRVDLETAQALEPAESGILTALAETYVLLNDLENAVNVLNTVIELEGSAANPAIQREITIYEGILAGGYDEEFLLRRADRFRQLGLFELALADIDFALENNPESAELFLRRGVILHSAGQYPDAVDSFTDALEIEPSAIGFFNRGYAYQAGMQEIRDSILLADSDLHCAVLLADSSITADQIAQAQRTITTTFITSDEYEPPTEAAQCVP